MKRQLWIIAMGLASLTLVGSPTTARAEEEACRVDGSWVLPDKCNYCCAEYCGSCNMWGWYVCGSYQEE